MAEIIAFILNLPHTLIGLLIAPVLGIKDVHWNKTPPAVVFHVRNTSLFDFPYKGWRGMAIGHVVLLNPREEKNDLEHELIHVEHMIKEPLIHPLLYQYECLRKGYRYNKYEDECYTRAGNNYYGPTQP
jgi:hypothetical protein